MKQIEPGVKSLDLLMGRLDRMKGWIEVKGKRYPSNNPSILNEVGYLLAAEVINPSDIRWGGSEIDHLEFIIDREASEGRPATYIVFSEELWNAINDINEKVNAWSDVNNAFIHAVERGEYPAPPKVVFCKDNRAFGNAVREFAKNTPGWGEGLLHFSVTGEKRERTDEEKALTLAASQGPADKDCTAQTGPGVESLDDTMARVAALEGSIIVKGKAYPSIDCVINEIDYLLETGDLILEEIAWPDGKKLQKRRSKWPECRYKADKKHIKWEVSAIGPRHPRVFSDSLGAIHLELCGKFRELKGER